MVHVIAGEFDGANGMIIEIIGKKALVSLRGYMDEKEIPMRFLKTIYGE